MPNKGLFPSKEGDRNAYYSISCPYLIDAANATRLGISAGNKTTLADAYAAYNTAYPLALNPDTRTATAVNNKNTADDNLQAIMRTVFADIPESVLTEQDRSVLNLHQRSTSSTPAPVPSTKPIVTIDAGNRLEHSVMLVDESSPTSRAKPAGVHGCQIWEKIGSPAVDASELTYVATVTKSPFINHFNGADAGKVVYYWARWENTRAETGPWSAVVAATIAG